MILRGIILLSPIFQIFFLSLKGKWTHLKTEQAPKVFPAAVTREFHSKKCISQMIPGIIQSGWTEQTQWQIRPCSSPLFILLTEETHLRLVFISLELLFSSYGQLGIWATKEKLAALCCLSGNVCFWPRIYQRNKATKRVKELLSCSAPWWEDTLCGDAGWNC